MRDDLPSIRARIARRQRVLGLLYLLPYAIGIAGILVLRFC